MTTLPPGPPPFRSDRPATRLLHDEPNVRIVDFHLLAGQRVPPHRNDSTVVVHVVSGEGVFHGRDTRATLRAGDCAAFAPGEDHAIEATAGPLHFRAMIAPRPGG